MANSSSKTIDISGIGEVCLEKSARAKRLSITIRPFSGVRVAVPLRVSFKEAGRFAVSKREWLLKHRLCMTTREQNARQLHQSHPIRPHQARRQIVDRLTELAARTGLTFNRVFVRNQKTRWGSCSHQDNISLNINLVRLPIELMDYVILHELVHTRIKNHSPKFWAALAEVIPDPKVLDRALRDYGALLRIAA